MGSFDNVLFSVVVDLLVVSLAYGFVYLFHGILTPWVVLKSVILIHR